MSGTYSELNASERKAVYEAMLRNVADLTDGQRSDILLHVSGWMASTVPYLHPTADPFMDGIADAFTRYDLPRVGWEF